MKTITIEMLKREIKENLEKANKRLRAFEAIKSVVMKRDGKVLNKSIDRFIIEAVEPWGSGFLSVHHYSTYFVIYTKGGNEERFYVNNDHLKDGRIVADKMIESWFDPELESRIKNMNDLLADTKKLQGVVDSWEDLREHVEKVYGNLKDIGLHYSKLFEVRIS